MISNSIQSWDEFSGNGAKRIGERFVIGRSWMSRELICHAVGTGERKVLVVGGFGGNEVGITELLREMITELEEAYSCGGRLYGLNLRPLLEENKFYFVPTVNPDGMDVFQKGISVENPFYQRVKNILKGRDTSEWCANIRGVTLWGNFGGQWIKRKLTERTEGIFGGAPGGYFGEYPESELESSSLVSFCRKSSPSLVIELRSSVEISFIPCGCEEKNLRLLSEYTGVKADSRTDELYGSFSLWAREETDCTSFILKCGKYGENTEKIKRAVLLASCV